MRLELVICAMVSACAGKSSGAPSSGASTGIEATSDGRPDGTAGTNASAAGCANGAPLAGASYDISKSRFAFGSTPSMMDAGGFVRWVGSDGAVAIFADGSAGGVLNAGAPEANRPDWSADGTKLTEHVIAYWEGMRVEHCQFANASLLGSGSGTSSNGGATTFVSGSTTANLARAIGGIPVAESIAYARFDIDDQTTSEGFYWPEIPASVVSAAFDFRDALANPNGLAAFKAKLPADAQGVGQITIHHTPGGISSGPFRSAVTYNVLQSAPPPADGGFSLGGTAELSFDADGKPVTAIR